MTTVKSTAGTAAPAGGALRICAYVTHAWPKQRGGSEVAMHAILRWLAGRGHQVRAIVKSSRGLPTDGVDYARRSAADRRQWIQEADVIFTQQGATLDAITLCEEFRKPLIVYAHNYLFAEYQTALHPDRHFMVWNTHFAAERNERWSQASTIVRPAVWPAEWAGKPGEHITQINLSKLKGGELFYKLVAELQGHSFLGVNGGWDNQLDRLGREWPHPNSYTKLAAVAPANLQIMQTQQDARRIYQQTRVLLVPTGNFGRALTGESYGLVAVEAMCSGIPVIATNSPGMAEALGNAGRLIDDPFDVDAWREAIIELDDPETYKAASDRALQRAQQLDPTPELEELERHLYEEIARCRRPQLSSRTGRKSTPTGPITASESGSTSSNTSPTGSSSSPTTEEPPSRGPAPSTKASKKPKAKSSSSATLTSSSLEDSLSAL